jgi:hypothetical protein
VWRLGDANAHCPGEPITMSTTKVTVDGQDFEIKAWTVRERNLFLKRLQEAPKATDPAKPTPEEAQAQLEFAIEFLAEQLGKDRDYVLGLNAVTFDKLFAEVVRANRAPLESLRL